MAINDIKMSRSTGKPLEGFPSSLDWDPFEEQMRDERKDPAAMRQKSPLDLAREYYAETNEDGTIPSDYPADSMNSDRGFNSLEPMESAIKYRPNRALDWQLRDEKKDPYAMRQMSPLDKTMRYHAELDGEGDPTPEERYYMRHHLEPRKFEEPMESAKRYEMLAKGNGPVLEEEEEEEYTPLDTMNDWAAINRGDYAKGNSKVWANRELANRGY